MLRITYEQHNPALRNLQSFARGNGFDGSLVPLVQAIKKGTRGTPNPHIVMKQQSRAEKTETKKRAAGDRMQRPRLMSLIIPEINPARELMICLGWLRLLETITKGRTANSCRRRLPCLRNLDG